MVHTLLLAPFTFAYLTASFVLASLAPVQSHLLPTSRPYERPLRTFRSLLHSMDLLYEVLEPDMLTLGAPLSREVGEGLPKVREFWWELSLGSYRGIGAEFIRRGIATRYEKWAANYRAMVVIAALMIWLSS